MKIFLRTLYLGWVKDVLNDATQGNGEISLSEISSLTPIVGGRPCVEREEEEEEEEEAEAEEEKERM